jgi:hypothetical protein
VKAVFKEGLTAQSADHYRQRIETLKKFKPVKKAASYGHARSHSGLTHRPTVNLKSR